MVNFRTKVSDHDMAELIESEPQIDDNEAAPPTSTTTSLPQRTTPTSRAPSGRPSVERNVPEGTTEDTEAGNQYDEEVTFGKYEHRLTLPHRASKLNAADSYFKRSSSLVYHYLDVDESSVVLGNFNALERITLFCGLCNRAGKLGMKGWNVNIRGRGSTTNYSTHLNNHHQKVWEEVQLLDKAGLDGGNVPDNSTSSGPLQQWLSEKVRTVFSVREPSNLFITCRPSSLTRFLRSLHDTSCSEMSHSARSNSLNSSNYLPMDALSYGIN